MSAETGVYVSCNICGSGESIRITVQNSCKVVRCIRCGFVYVNPRPQSSAYSEIYVDYLPSKMADPYSWKAYMRGVFRYTADIIESIAPIKGRVMDIGCGFGFFVEEMKSRGWEASGMDISTTAVSFARGIGLDVRLGTIEDLTGGKNAFDALTMFYVLEHVPDPLDTLKKVYSILKPGGVLILRVPHTTPIVRFLDFFGIRNNLYDPPFHLSDFSPETMRMILEKSGYRDIRTFIGGATLPGKPGPLFASVTSTVIAEAAYRLSGGRFLLPGVSKTTVARKP